MNKLGAMRVFVEVAECQSFAEASRKLDISPPAVTRSVAQLEKLLGAKLFNRTTRLVRLTDAGNRYLVDTKRILEAIDEAEAAAVGSYRNPEGILTVTAPVLFGQKYIVPIVVEYLRRNPGVSVRLELLDRVTNLIEEGLDVAIRIGPLPESNLFAVTVGHVRRVVCGSPDYFETHGKPLHPSDLDNHRIVLASTVEHSSSWSFQGEDKISVKVSPRLYCNHNSAAIRAATAGWGVTRLMSYQVAEEIRQRELVTVLNDFETRSLAINVVHLEGRRANAKTRAFLDIAVNGLRDNPLIR